VIFVASERQTGSQGWERDFSLPGVMECIAFSGSKYINKNFDHEFLRSMCRWSTLQLFL
jgi:hypothetical protein